MIFLLLKIFVYLLIAAAIGGVAGWLLRNLQAQRTDENAHRQMHDAKAKLPQLESLLRSRDQQLEKMKDRQTEYKEMAREMQDKLVALEKELRDERDALRRARQSLAAQKLMQETPADADATDQQELDQLRETCATLRDELAQAQKELQKELQQNLQKEQQQEQALKEQVAASANEDQQAAIAELQQALEHSQAALQREQDKVAELEHEHAIHNKSLHVLHQQLEQERSRRIAAS